MYKNIQPLASSSDGNSKLRILIGTLPIHTKYGKKYKIHISLGKEKNNMDLPDKFW